MPITPAMRIVLLSLVLSATRVFGSGNCKCQDAQGQYDDATESCCDAQKGKYGGFNDIHWPGINNQCVSGMSVINGHKFRSCCSKFVEPNGYVVGGAFCW